MCQSEQLTRRQQLARDKQLFPNRCPDLIYLTRNMLDRGYTYHALVYACHTKEKAKELFHCGMITAPALLAGQHAGTRV